MKLVVVNEKEEEINEPYLIVHSLVQVYNIVKYDNDLFYYKIYYKLK